MEDKKDKEDKENKEQEEEQEKNENRVGREEVQIQGCRVVTFEAVMRASLDGAQSA